MVGGGWGGGERAWEVAEKAVGEGAEIVLTNAPVAIRSGEIYQLSEALNAPVIPADATSIKDLEQLFTEAQEKLGGKIDFVLHSIGMSPNVRKGRTYAVLNHHVDNFPVWERFSL